MFEMLVIFLSASLVAGSSFFPGEVNSNVQFLWAVPLERILFFSSPNEDGGKPLLPDWMRQDMNLIALQLYERFQAEMRTSNITHDSRDAESTVKAFREFQHTYLPRGSNNSTDLHNLLCGSSANETHNELDLNRESTQRAIASLSGFGKLLGKIATDFVDRMGFSGGTKFLYQARMWAEVLAPGDFVEPKNVAAEGAVAAGVIFTHIPPDAEGTPRFELLDPRGHNPPFGQDQRLEAQQGVGLLFPAWVDRLTPPHRLKQGGAISPRSHRIDWVFEIGLFQFPEEALVRFYDLEMCPFAHSFNVPANQHFLQLDVEELVKIDLHRPSLSSS